MQKNQGQIHFRLQNTLCLQAHLYSCTGCTCPGDGSMCHKADQNTVKCGRNGDKNRGQLEGFRRHRPSPGEIDLPGAGTRPLSRGLRRAAGDDAACAAATGRNALPDRDFRWISMEISCKTGETARLPRVFRGKISKVMREIPPKPAPAPAPASKRTNLTPK